MRPSVVQAKGMPKCATQDGASFPKSNSNDNYFYVYLLVLMFFYTRTSCCAEYHHPNSLSFVECLFGDEGADDNSLAAAFRGLKKQSVGAR